jgi:hypothetical protein
MGETAFTDTPQYPQYRTYRTAPGVSEAASEAGAEGSPFFSPGSDDRSNLFQANHTTPVNILDDDALSQALYRRISGADVSSDFRYVHNSFASNGQFLPTTAADALRLGVARHLGSHPWYDEFVKARDQEIVRRGELVLDAERERLLSNPETAATADAEARKAADLFMAKEKKGLNKFLEMAVQEGGIREASLAAGDTLLVFNDGDPRNLTQADGWAQQHNQKAIAEWKMDQIAGQLDVTKPGGGYLSGTAGTEAFRAGVAGTELDYDRLRVNGNGNFIWTKEMRAEIIARDYIVGFDGVSNVKAADRLRSEEFKALVSKVESILSDGRIFLPQNSLPNNLQDIFGKINNASLGKEALKEQLSSLAEAMRASNPAAYDNFMAQGRKDGIIPDDKASAKTGYALTAAQLGLSYIFIQNQYKAETIDAPNKSFVDWAAEKTPEFLANMPAAFTVGVGTLGLAFMGPYGMALSIALGAVAGYDALKQFMWNYVGAHSDTPDALAVKLFGGIISGMNAIEQQPIVKFATKIGAVFGDAVLKPLFASITPQLYMLTGVHELSTSSNGTNAPNTRNWWFIGKEAASFSADSSDSATSNKFFHFGYGQVHAGGGNDWLIGWRPQYVKQGEYLLEVDRDRARQNESLPPGQQWQIDGPKAEKDYQLVLDGGPGKDRIIVLGGTGAITIGGDGEDFIFNSSWGGKIYGDSIDGTGTRSRDVIWWTPGTFLMDAGPEDSLQFFGLPLTGGTGVKHETGEQWAYDWALPFIRYGLSESGQLIVQSSLSNILNHTLRSAPGNEILRSSMIVENFDQGEGGNWAHIARGDLGMTFRIWDFNASEKFGGFESVWGMLINRLDALKDFGKMLKWVSADDPLVLDLDGDGIETTERDFEGVHFDFNGDHFAELSGWVGADDGFLVLDRDGNGRIDDISELFGAPGGSGFAELRLVDEDATGLADGRIDANDVVFTRLQVWRDLNQDGVSQQGELFSLADLGIVSMIDALALNVTAPSGTLLREKATFTRADEKAGNIFEAALKSGQRKSKPRNRVRRQFGWRPAAPVKITRNQLLIMLSFQLTCQG